MQGTLDLPSGWREAARFLAAVVLHHFFVALLVAAPLAAIQTILLGKRRPPGVYCHKCGYNLRGLPELRCPECGAHYSPGYAQLGQFRQFVAALSLWAGIVGSYLWMLLGVRSWPFPGTQHEWAWITLGLALGYLLVACSPSARVAHRLFVIALPFSGPAVTLVLNRLPGITAWLNHLPTIIVVPALLLALPAALAGPAWWIESRFRS